MWVIFVLSSVLEEQVLLWMEQVGTWDQAVCKGLWSTLAANLLSGFQNLSESTGKLSLFLGIPLCRVLVSKHFTLINWLIFLQPHLFNSYMLCCA